MNKTGECPKCHEFQVVRAPATPQDLRVPIGGLASVPIALYICCSCGYVEQWIDDERDLPRVAKAHGG